MCWATQGLWSLWALPVSSCCFLVLGAGALSVAAKGPGLTWLAKAVLTALNAAHFRLRWVGCKWGGHVDPLSLTCLTWQL